MHEVETAIDLTPLVKQVMRARHPVLTPKNSSGGYMVSGEELPVADPPLEIAELYKVTHVGGRQVADETRPPSWLGVPPRFTVYANAVASRLAVRIYEEKDTSCIWVRHRAVEMIIDQRNPSKRGCHHIETFCYGPRSCPSSVDPDRHARLPIIVG
jgi:hypothetical protein